MPQPKAKHTIVMLDHPCSECGAQPGDRCRTARGNVKQDFHVARSRAASANNWESQYA